MACFIRHFASRNPLSSDAVCPLNSTLNHATTFTQQTILAELILTCHDVTPHHWNIADSYGTVFYCNTKERFELSSTKHPSIKETPTESQQIPTKQATIVKQSSSFE